MDPSPTRVEEANLNLHTIEEQISKTQLDQTTHSSQYQVKLDEPVLVSTETYEDDIERIRDENKLVEKLIQTIANISQDLSVHQELIENGLVPLIKKYVVYFSAKAQPYESEVDMELFPIIALNVVQSLSIAIVNIC